ncbi:MAG TPA: hypothetical protein VE326_10450 [Candidatus Binatia bacterium]|nr:hypothetical protein [Candidatus Binatia bacterium]
MKRFGLTLYRRTMLGLTAAATLLFVPPALGQDSTSVSTSHTSMTTSTSSEFVSDWRLWALVGAVVLIILIIALTRRGSGGDTTTIVK